MDKQLITFIPRWMMGRLRREAAVENSCLKREKRKGTTSFYRCGCCGWAHVEVINPKDKPR